LGRNTKTFFVRWIVGNSSITRHPPTDSERETTVKVSSARTMPQHLETGLKTTEMTEYGKHGKS
jgi:hypothetical protein